ncbi:hypothetical protein ACWCYY_19275 [Kitasatospora sp. NPDC001664]
MVIPVFGVGVSVGLIYNVALATAVVIAGLVITISVLFPFVLFVRWKFARRAFRRAVQQLHTDLQVVEAPHLTAHLDLLVDHHDDEAEDEAFFGELDDLFVPTVPVGPDVDAATRQLSQGLAALFAEIGPPPEATPTDGSDGHPPGSAPDAPVFDDNDSVRSSR